MTLTVPTVLGAGEGDRWWFLNHVHDIKLTGADSGGAMSVIEFEGTTGFGPPPHVHEREDELFYVLEGRVSFWCDGAEATHGPGAMAFLPRGLPHRFEVAEGPARVLLITAPAQFEDFVKEFGEHLGDGIPPEPTEPDLARLVEVCRRYGIDILA